MPAVPRVSWNLDSHRTHVRIESVSVYLALRSGGLGASVRVWLPVFVFVCVDACAAGPELLRRKGRERPGHGGGGARIRR
jgi:hypothetical protein